VVPEGNCVFEHSEHMWTQHYRVRRGGPLSRDVAAACRRACRPPLDAASRRSPLERHQKMCLACLPRSVPVLSLCGKQVVRVNSFLQHTTLVIFYRSRDERDRQAAARRRRGGRRGGVRSAANAAEAAGASRGGRKAADAAPRVAGPIGGASFGGTL